MIIEENFTVRAPAQAVSDFFLDIDRVSKCVPGVGEVRTVGDGEYEATLSVRVGPVAASFLGSVALDASEAPTRLKASGQGKDRASGSRVEVKFAADLVEVGDVTEVRSEADVVVRGRLGQFGTSVIKATSHELVKEFSACVNASLATQASAASVAEDSADAAEPNRSPGAASSAPATPPTPAQAAPLKVLPLVGRILLGMLTALVQRVAAWLRGLRGSR